MSLEYTPVPRWAVAELASEGQRAPDLGQRLERWAGVQPRLGDAEGATEIIDGVEVTHHFAEAPGDSEMVRWHYVEAGAGEPVLFVHGFGASWFMWHRQIAAVAASHRVIAIDLKGYGQSDKRTGDYRQEGVAEQLAALLDVLGLDGLNVVAHDRGAAVTDYLCANESGRILRYGRGAQHLYHFDPVLAPQEQRRVDPHQSISLCDPVATVVGSYARTLIREPPDEHMERAIQEFAYPQIGWAVPRYFNSSSFRQEWIDRRTRLMEAWTFPVLIMQGYHDHHQPREFYKGTEHHMPNAEVTVRIIDGGHNFPVDAPEETTDAIIQFLKS